MVLSSTQSYWNLPEKTEDDEPVFCPHCLHRFVKKEAKYIAQHPDLGTDNKLGNSGNSRVDKKSVRPKGISGNLMDRGGFRIFDRACPNCHLQIPVAILDKRPLFISIAGAPASGKTYLTTVMLHELRRILPKQFGLSVEYCDSLLIKSFTDLEEVLFNSEPSEPAYLPRTSARGTGNSIVKLEGIDVELSKPFLFSIQPTSDCVEKGGTLEDLRQNIAIYDTAGERFRPLADRNSTLRTTEHLGVSDAILFVFDPLQDAGILKLLGNHPDPQIRLFRQEKQFERQDMILQSVIASARRFRNQPTGERLRIPLLVCVQKYDIWKGLLPNWAQTTGDSWRYFDSQGTSALDLTRVNQTSLHIRKFLEGFSPEFVAAAESSFTAVRYFPVSALGTSPSLDPSGMLSIQPGNLKPIKVVDPLLWLLRDFGLIRVVQQPKGWRPYWRNMLRMLSLKAKTASPAGEKAVILSKNRDGFVIRLPGSKQKVGLDWEFSGLTIRDPWNGEKVSIPSVKP